MNNTTQRIRVRYLSRPRLGRVMVYTVLMATLVLFPACTANDRAGLHEAAAEAQHQIELAQTELDALASDPIVADDPATSAAIERIQREMERWQRQAATAEAALAKAQVSGDALSDGAKAVAPTLPYPWNLIVGLGVPLAVSIATNLKQAKTNRATRDDHDRLRQSAEAVVIAIEQEKVGEDGTVAFRSAGQGTSLRSRMASTPGAIALVEAARAKLKTIGADEGVGVGVRLAGHANGRRVLSPNQTEERG